jgi:hypothetical protein
VYYPPLDVFEGMTGITLIPVPVEVFGRDPELDDEIAREVLGLGFAALFSPEAEQRIFIITHYDAGVRTANESATICVQPVESFCFHVQGFLRAK